MKTLLKLLLLVLLVTSVKSFGQKFYITATIFQEAGKIRPEWIASTHEALLTIGGGYLTMEMDGGTVRYPLINSGLKANSDVLLSSFIKDNRNSELKVILKKISNGYYELSIEYPDGIAYLKCKPLSGESVIVDDTPLLIRDFNSENKKHNDNSNKLETIDNNSYTSNQLILSKFNIPINPEKYVEPGTKPQMHDAGLKSIKFISNAVIHQQPGKRSAVDDLSTWTLSLSSDDFVLEGSNGVVKTYLLIDIEYDEQMKMQSFMLGSSPKEITHNLLISWVDSRNHYSIIFNSNDKTESYQFQEVQAITKQYQKNNVADKNEINNEQINEPGTFSTQNLGKDICCKNGDFGMGFHAIPLYAELIMTNISSLKEAERDSLYLHFREFVFSQIEYLNQNIDSLFPNLYIIMEDKDNDEAKVILDDLYKSGLTFFQSEGSYYIDEIPNYFAVIFHGSISNVMDEYLDIRSAEINEGFAEDAALMINFGNLYERTILWENFMSTYPDFFLIPEIKANYQVYLSTLLTGLDNTPAFDFETKKLNAELQTVYKMVIVKNDQRTSTKVIKKYYNYLKVHGFRKPENLNEFLKVNGYFSMIGIQ